MIKLFNGRYTMKNRATGEHRTFMLKTQPEDAAFAAGKRILSLLTGPDNESDYTGFAFVDEDGIHVWKSKRSLDGSKSAWQYYAELLWSFGVDAGFSSFAGEYEFMMEGRCARCNRALTEPESIANGIGPICAEKAA